MELKHNNRLTLRTRLRLLLWDWCNVRANRLGPARPRPAPHDK